MNSSAWWRWNLGGGSTVRGFTAASSRMGKVLCMRLATPDWFGARLRHAVWLEVGMARRGERGEARRLWDGVGGAGKVGAG